MVSDIDIHVLFHLIFIEHFAQEINETAWNIIKFSCFVVYHIRNKKNHTVAHTLNKKQTIQYRCV